jgi:hypothetical protein
LHDRRRAWSEVFAAAASRFDRDGLPGDKDVADTAAQHLREIWSQLDRVSGAWPQDDTLIDWTPPEQPPLIDRPGVIFAFICVTFAIFVAALALGFGG